MSDRPPRYWTPGEADAALPWVTEVIERARAAAAAAAPARGLRRPGAPSSNGHRPASDGQDLLAQALGELAESGIMVRDLHRGLVDFPALSPTGRPYWLCWIVGEPRVAWWHWPHTGFAGRTPLDEPPI